MLWKDFPVTETLGHCLSCHHFNTTGKNYHDTRRRRFTLNVNLTWGGDVTEAYVSLCARTGGFDKRSEGTGQCGRLALQGGGCYVRLPATPLQGCHRRLPGEVQRGVGGGGTSITGKHSHQKVIFWELFFFPPSTENSSYVCLSVH